MSCVVLTFVGCYIPGYRSGGPIQSIANMVELLGDELEFRIVTRDRDTLAAGPYPGIKVDAWNCVGKGLVFYASSKTLTLSGIITLLRETRYDVLYLNSFFDPIFTILPLFARYLRLTSRRPTIIAPRGEFSPGAFRLKRWKKCSYLILARLFGFYSGLTWQASSERECADIRRALGDVAARVVVAPNLTEPSAARVERRVGCSAGRLRVVFLSRISPKKNLDFALRILAQVKATVEFDIYGPIVDEGYWHDCEDLIHTLPPNLLVRYQGELVHDAVRGVLAQYHLFFLPTRGENFGHAIFESLSVGTPALISDQTPWSDDGSGGCTVLSLQDPGQFIATIEYMASLSGEERQARRNAAEALALAYSIRQDSKTMNLKLFHGALNA